MLGDQRALFSLPEDLRYLNCAARSPMLNASHAAGLAALERQLVPQSTAPEAYFLGSESVRAKVGALMHTSPDRVALVPSVSYGLAIATYNHRVNKGHTVVVPEEEFLSDVYGWIAACQRAGGTLRPVPRPRANVDASARWSEAIVAAIDASTSVVNLSTVHWTDGLIFDVASIARRAREVGALVVIDATQSVGAVPFDYDEVQPDLLLCADYKWLFGPYQLGVAIVGDRLLEGEPFEHHWSNRAGSEDTSGTDYLHEFRDGARKFDVGEHVNDINLSMLDVSLDQVLAWGPNNIEAYCRQLLQPLENYLGDSPYQTSGAGEHCAHIIGVRSDDDALLDRAAEQMAARNIRISRRGSALRISPHLYNTRDDIDAVIEALDVAVTR
ncbi:MAG: selenocysteine lyase/cysteine desulfurase [Gammaproteobacteria bacterium]|jgi:selenocysteine lyase/cysteine desulfurase